MFTIVPFALSHCYFRYAEQGLAHALGLYTFRHGTNMASWVGIHLVGAAPRMGDNPSGGDFGNGYSHVNVNRFYLAKDSDLFECQNPTPRNSIMNRIVMRFLPKSYTVRSNILLFERFSRIELMTIFKDLSRKYNNSHISKIETLKLILVSTTLLAIGVFSAIFIPTIKFRFSPDQIRTFQPDKTISGGLACSTDNWIHPLNIGIIGTLFNSLTYKTPIRMAKDPLRVITGVAMLALSGFVGQYALVHHAAFLSTHQVSILAGAALAVI